MRKLLLFSTGLGLVIALIVRLYRALPTTPRVQQCGICAKPLPGLPPSRRPYTCSDLCAGQYEQIMAAIGG